MFAANLLFPYIVYFTPGNKRSTMPIAEVTMQKMNSDFPLRINRRVEKALAPGIIM